MGALIFYTFIYFIGHFFALGFNILKKHKSLNQYWVGLAGVVIVAILHSYSILTSTPPSGEEEGVMYALSYFVIFPVAAISVVLFYLNGKDKTDDSSS